jgi:CRP-like cAMP-binding protein
MPSQKRYRMAAMPLPQVDSGHAQRRSRVPSHPRSDAHLGAGEKRLARVLLMLAHFGKEGIPESVIPKISQETLAEMVGTTRSRVNFFMNRFKKLGFIDYAGGAESGLQVRSSLLKVVLDD